MKVITDRFGEVEVQPEEVLTFTKGLLGFEETSKYILLPVDEKQQSPFYFLQSVEDEKLSFLLLDVFAYFPKYHAQLDDSVIKRLNIEQEEEVLLLTMVTVQGSLQEATTNLKAPVVINIAKKLGQQVVLNQGDYLIKQPVFDQDPSKLKVEKG